MERKERLGRETTASRSCRRGKGVAERERKKRESGMLLRKNKRKVKRDVNNAKRICVNDCKL